MMRLAVRLGVTPERFWRLSMREWRWLTAAGEAPAMTRAEMERLVARWPDGAVGARPASPPPAGTGEDQNDR